MIEVISHIRDLLYRYECVIIPGFGAFLIHHKSAFVDEATGNFVPPQKSLSFNRQLQSNDGLLANYLAVNYGLSYLEALQNLREQTLVWTEQLENNTSISFEGLGKIQPSEEDKWEFIADENNVFANTSFGLSPLKLTALQTQTETHVPVVSISQGKSKRPWAYAAAIIALGMGIAGFAWYKNDVEQYNIAQQQIADKQVEEQIHTASFSIANPLPAVQLTIKEEVVIMPYHVVAGAFREPENAEKKVAQLHEAGYEEAYILGENRFGLYEVVYKSYESKNQAINEMRRIIRTDNENAWLLIKED